MNRLIHRVALAAVLVHMVCGCCWHHAHAHVEEHSDHAEHAAGQPPHADDAHDPCLCGHSSHESVPREEPCQGRACDFVRAESDASSQPLEASRFEAPASADIVPGDSLARRLSALPVAGPGPPLRLHLVIQRLLV